MTEKEMIEEMAKDTGGCDVSYRECSKCWRLEERKCSAYVYAKKLIEQGYRKIKDNDLYIPEEYIEEFGNFIATSPQTKQTMEGLIKAWQKETATEILSLAIKHNDGYETDMAEFISDLKKQYGVEE